MSAGWRAVTRRSRGAWQRRVWEHTSRDEDDLVAHFDYIHYNSVKHGLVQRSHDWLWSSFHRRIRAGRYAVGWAAALRNQPLPGDAEE